MRRNFLFMKSQTKLFCLAMLTCSLLLFNACKKDTANDSLKPSLSLSNATNSLATLATTNSGGYSTTTGAGSLAAVTVTNLSQLQTAISNGNRHIIISGNIYGGSVPLTFTFSTTAWNNTTIEGASGGGAILQNIQLKFDGELLSSGTNIQNILVKNITFYGNIPALQALPSSETDISVSGNHSGVNYLGVSFRRCTNVWFDHCAIYNTSDDLWCATLLSDNLTISYCHFYFTSSWLNMSPNPSWNWVGNYQPLADERLCAVIGQNYTDSYTYGSQKLHITMHHNWFGPLLKGRPLCRGYVHFYNNYFDNSTSGSGQYNAIQIGSGSKVYSESNYFYQTNQTNQVGLDDATHTAYTFCEQNNTYNTSSIGVSGAAWPGSTPVSYTYSVIAASSVPSTVQSQAGPH
ncbi:pectate lyase family protein [Mucilaginibacter paludis]|uniref:Pectate lyase/Amb allergen n=1 Tax=Mucilaginibacter paludis DSM 18603 TaxID=714943 RepID=H1Y875_9SPHI|nr:pectate lyase [Mucilaginibacter paludis]EHQ31097.1 Pectate lyase/Amb allergen [Mucilaginibacter paludis DSM 18603]